MRIDNLTEEESAVVMQGLAALVHRLRHKITNDERHGREDFNRVAHRRETIERANVLIERFKEEDVIFRIPSEWIP